MKHIDPIGIICCAFFGFGWARPVQINPSNFRNIKKGIIWTSIAGVLMNLALSFLGYGFFKLACLIPASNYLVIFLQTFLYYIFQLNICLAVFNILPIYPLDGFKVVEATTKYNNNFVNFMYKYGNLLLILLIVFCDQILFRLISWVSMPITWFWELIF
jgi:Zn-dependent protease